MPAIFALGLGCATAGAQHLSLDRIEADLAVIKARVVEGPKGYTIIDKGHSSGVQKGDLWSLYSAAGDVFDPQTGKKIGEFSVPAVLCRAVQVQGSFAAVETKCLAEECIIEPGMEAFRYKHAGARFIDPTGAFFELYKALRLRLDHLDWHGYEKGADRLRSNPPSLWEVVFVAGDDGLTLWSGGELRAVYTTADDDRAEAPGSSQPGEPAVLTRPAPFLEPAGFREIARVNETIRNIGAGRSAKSQSPYLVWLAGRTVSAADRNGRPVHKYTYQGFGRPVSMSVSGRDLVALNVLVPDSGMASMILKITDAGFRKVAENIPYLLAFMQDPQNKGGTELWGQRFSRSEMLLPVVHKLRIAEGSATRAGSVDVPFGYSLLGAFFADLNGNGVAEHGFFNPGGRLAVYESGEKIWESREKFSAPAGTLLVSDPEYPEGAPRRLEVWSRPVVFRHAGRTCAAMTLKRAGWAQMIGGGAEAGQIGIFCAAQASYRLGLPAGDLNGSVHDVSVVEDSLLVCTAEGGSLSSGGSSRILSVPISKVLAAGR